jgi:hypothetical protein
MGQKEQVQVEQEREIQAEDKLHKLWIEFSLLQDGCEKRNMCACEQDCTELRLSDD